MTDTNPQNLLIEHDELLAKLSDVLWDSGLNNAARDVDAAVERLHAYLAQSEPEVPTDEELLAIAAASIDPYQDSGIAIGEYEPETERAIHVYGSELITFAHAVLARWGK